MFKLCNIYPLKDQEMYKKETNIMILAHLAHEYNPKNFLHANFIIMDNGAFEKQQVSTSLQDLIWLAFEMRKKGIHVSELVIPDAMFDMSKTIELFNKNRSIVEAYNSVFSFMFVLQANNIEEFTKIFNYANSLDIRNLTLGVPRVKTLDRYSPEVIALLRRSKHEVHYLGIKDYVAEVKPVADLIRSCDSSQINYIARQLSPAQIEKVHLEYFSRNENDGLIDLANDYVDTDKLVLTREKLKKETKDYVVL